MGISVSELKMSDGTRRGCISEDGLLTYYPNLFITSRMRHRSKNTHIAFLHNLKVLFYWLSYEGIDLESRFKRSQHLSELEINRLVNFCAWSAETHQKLLKGSVSLHPKAYRQIKREAYHQRVTAIREYMGWLFDQLAKTPHKEEEKSRVKATMRSLAPRLKQHQKNGHVELSESQLKAITEKLMPDHPENPWDSECLQYRNLLIFHLLYETGMRRGELLGLYVSDIQDDCVSIVRRHNNPLDPRTQQPNAKTGERTIPIPKPLSALAYEYVITHRGALKKPKKHPYLLVNHKSQGGAGEPLSIASIDYVFRTARDAVPELKGVSPHSLRHHMNYRISKFIDEKFAHLSPEERQKKDEIIRSYQMGWSPTGNQQVTYNRRYHIEQANEASLERANKYEKSTKTK